MAKSLDYYLLDEELTEEERLVRDNVGRFVDEKIKPIIAEHYEAGTFPMELIAQFGELGLLGRTSRATTARAWGTSPTASRCRSSSAAIVACAPFVRSRAASACTPSMLSVRKSKSRSTCLG